MKKGQLTDTLTRNITILSVMFLDSHDQHGQYDTYKNGQYCPSYDRKKNNKNVNPRFLQHN